MRIGCDIPAISEYITHRLEGLDLDTRGCRGNVDYEGRIAKPEEQVGQSRGERA
jgi:hypothetical protein